MASVKKCPSIDAIRVDAIRLLSLAIRMATNPSVALEAIDASATRMEAIPYTTEECSIARNRLANARRYLCCGERGAAIYELNIVARSLVTSRMVESKWSGRQKPETLEFLADHSNRLPAELRSSTAEITL